jgi:hypothetical protein
VTIKKQMRQIIGKKATRRAYRAAPWVGGAIALASVGGAMRRKTAGIDDALRGASAPDRSSAQ